MADTPLTPPSVVPPSLDPLRASHEADDYEAELKDIFIEVFEAMLRPAERRLNSYGAPHRGAFSVVERAVKAEGLAMERATSAEAYMAELYRAWRARNPKRGTAFLKHYLQLLWPNQWSIAQLWQDPTKPYPAATSEVEQPGWFLTSRIRVNLDTADVADYSRLIGSFRAVIPARFVLDMTVRGGFNGGLRIANALQTSEMHFFTGTATTEPPTPLVVNAAAEEGDALCTESGVMVAFEAPQPEA